MGQFIENSSNTYVSIFALDNWCKGFIDELIAYFFSWDLSTMCISFKVVLPFYNYVAAYFFEETIFMYNW